MKRRLIIAALISAFALASCGIKGEMTRPAPLWGEDNRTEAEKAGVAGKAETNAPEVKDEPSGRKSIRIEAPEPVESPDG